MRNIKKFESFNDGEDSIIETLEDICFDITDNLPNIRCSVESGEGYLIDSERVVERVRVVIFSKRYNKWYINSIISETLRRMISYMNGFKYTIEIVNPDNDDDDDIKYKIDEIDGKKLKAEEYLVIEFINKKEEK